MKFTKLWTSAARKFVALALVDKLAGLLVIFMLTLNQGVYKQPDFKS